MKNNKSPLELFKNSASSLYYSALSGAKNDTQLNAVMTGAFYALQPFYQYLERAVKIAEERQVRAKWEELPSPFRIKVSLAEKWIILPKADKQLRMTASVFENDEEIELSFPQRRQRISFQKKELIADGDFVCFPWAENQPFIPEDGEKITFWDEQLEWNFVEDAICKGDLLENEQGKKYQVSDVELLPDGTRKIRLPEFSSSKIRLPSSEKYVEFKRELPEWNDSEYSLVSDAGKNISLTNSQFKNNFWIFEAEKEFGTKGKWAIEEIPVQIQPDRKQEGIWIELIEDESDDENAGGETYLKYFFDDEVREVWNPKDAHYDGSKIKHHQVRTIQVRRKKQEEFQILLKERPDSDYLYLPVNTYQLKKQKDAVQCLQRNPFSAHQGLLRLTENKEHSVRMKTWPVVTRNNQPIEWCILGQDGKKRDGEENQKAFVRKAMATSDFAFLEGPPGSGKTTAICELIIQLAKQGKRILLTASTHVAIDNVLENLFSKHEKMAEELLIASRVGDEGSVDRSLRKFQLTGARHASKLLSEQWQGWFRTSDNQLSQSEDSFSDFMLSVSNLVCGTVTGILQHPQIKEQQFQRNRAIQPDFDYLILDEASKTTFQQFLVPAMFAKHWIIVGDIHQLSPYTERQELEANLENLVDSGGTTIFDSGHQHACLLAYQILNDFPGSFFKSQNIRDKNIPLIVVQPFAVLEKFVAELDARLSGKASYHPELIAAISSKQFSGFPKSEQWISVSWKDLQQSENMESLAVHSADILLIEESLYPKLRRRIPPGLNLFKPGYEYSEPDAYTFRLKYWLSARKIKPFRPPRHRRCETLSEIQDYLNKETRTKTWAGEFGWRMVREYELRILEWRNKESWTMNRYKEALDALKPKNNAKRIEILLENIQNIALPSMLECLQKGVGKQGKRDKPTVLNSGLPKNVWNHRAEKLEYQNRMHKEISVFPRKEFYEGEALKDSNLLDREWDYSGYGKNAVWKNVQGKLERNYNIEEAKQVLQELKAFCKWAKHNPPPTDQKHWKVACITFYRGQESQMSKKLKTYCDQPKNRTNFTKDGIRIKVCTVDRFQGQEADLLLLSMVRTRNRGVGFMDSPNRLNVAITRARYQLVVVGDHDHFKNQRNSDCLKNLADWLPVF